LREFEADYRKYRPRTHFFALFVSDVSGNQAELFVSDRVNERSSANRESAGLQGGNISEVTVPTMTLTDLLNQQGVSHIDLLSIDIELSEPKALAGFDIEKFRPRLVCIEAHPQVRQQILDYFARHRYVLLGKYLRADTLNLYFAPLG
jgi:FkbM family methyltransferase